MSGQVTDYTSNAPENVVHAAEAIGRSRLRKRVFEEIYRGKRKVKRVSALMQATGYSLKQVLNAGKHLADKGVVVQTREEGQTAYRKIDFIHRHKTKILTAAPSRRKRDAIATKRNPAGSIARLPATLKVTLRTAGMKTQPRQVTVDDIDSLTKVRGVRKSAYLEDLLSEDAFKGGFREVVGEMGAFRDWPGETHDLFTTQLRVAGKRRSAAIAFKGPGMKGKLVPGKLGKNGDQIQRLFQSPAEVFLVQYCRQIDPSVLTQMQQLAVARALTASDVFYGIIDGADSLRLVKAYPKEFSSEDS
jgi:hypothetical protein